MHKKGTRKRPPAKACPAESPPKLPRLSGVEPFPSHPRPTPQECRSVRDDLLTLHGFPREFDIYREQRRRDPSDGVFSGGGSVKSEPLSGEDDDGGYAQKERESVLDGLVSVVLSQNTTDANSRRAFASLKSSFPTWEEVLAAESKCVENAIRCGGLAATKASCIKNILTCLLKRKGKLCLEYLRDLSIDEVKNELSCFKGIGPKTVACVLLFQLQRDDFPVDTHVFQIAKAVGWIPAVADRNKAYLHLNQRIPNALKFDLNCLLFTHGKLCRKCTTRGSKQNLKETDEASCPLLNYCQNSSEA